MAARKFEERKVSGSTAGRIAIILCLHVLLWTALYITASTIYSLVVGAITVKDIPSVVLLLVSSAVSIFYVALHNATTRLLHTSDGNPKQCERADTLRSLAVFTMRVLTTLWLISAAISVTVTTSRRALCELDGTSQELWEIMPLDRGTTCILNRTAILSSFAALLASGSLLLLLTRLPEPFHTHLLGTISRQQQPHLLPLSLPNLAMRSEISFKCRSSTSVESSAQRSIFAPTKRRNSSAANSSPLHNPRNTLGLGISTSKTALPPAAAVPRPLVMVECGLLPSPPRPIYTPYTYQVPPPRPIRTRNLRTELARRNSYLEAAAPHREDSGSSVYSRSTSGDSLRPGTTESGEMLIGGSDSSISSSTLEGAAVGLGFKMHGGGNLGPGEGYGGVDDELAGGEVDGVGGEKIRTARMESAVVWSVRAGVMGRHVRDTWVESPNLEVRVESPDLVLRAKSWSPRKKIQKVVRESGREHGMF